MTRNMQRIDKFIFLGSAFIWEICFIYIYILSERSRSEVWVHFVETFHNRDHQISLMTKLKHAAYGQSSDFHTSGVDLNINKNVWNHVNSVKLIWTWMDVDIEEKMYIRVSRMLFTVVCWS